LILECQPHYNQSLSTSSPIIGQDNNYGLTTQFNLPSSQTSYFIEIMDFSTHFFWHSLLATLVAAIWFTLPGILILRHLGFKQFPNLLVAPALGLCTFGPFSLGITTLIGYSVTTLLGSWLTFQIILLWKTPPASNLEPFYPSTVSSTVLLLFGTLLWALLTTLPIYPAVYEQGLFVNTPIFDHAKVALVDAIARQGLLPINPYYAPNGEDILLIYYYTWHFLASQLKLLTFATGWQVEVAMNAFTAIATLSFLSALAMRITQKTQAGIWVILFAFMGLPIDLLPDLFGPRWQQWLTIPPGHGLELLWLQMMWVPQHVLSALGIVIILFLISRALHSTWQPRLGIIIGLSAAAAFGASTWVGGIALVLISPALLLAALALRLPVSHYSSALKTLGLALGIAFLFSLPLLISQASGPPLQESALPFGWNLLATTRLIDRDSLEGKLAHILLFWLQFLPLNLGIVYLIGLTALLARQFPFGNNLPLTETRFLHAFSLTAVIGYFLITQFLQSTFWNNSFAWRAVLVPVMLLSIWAAVALTELLAGQQQHWRPRSLLVRFRAALLPITVMGLTLGGLSTLRVWHLPDPSYAPPPPEKLALHQGFLRQHRAWEKVRDYVAPNERVQVNPEGYADLTPWPATLPYSLFADRAIAYANIEYATVFAYRYDPQLNTQQYQWVKSVFSAHPPLDSLQKMHDTLKVKALLIDKFDPIWAHSHLLENGEFYQLAYQEEDFKIYLAR